MKYDNDKVDFTISGGATRHFTVLHLHYLYCFLNLPFPEPWLVCVPGSWDYPLVYVSAFLV